MSEALIVTKLNLKKRYVKYCRQHHLKTFLDDRDERYFSWKTKDVTHQKLTIAEYEEQVKLISKKCKKANSRTIKKDWTANTYLESKTPWERNCYYIDEEGNKKHIFVEARTKDTAGKVSISKEVRKVMKPLFEETAGRSMQDVYGQVSKDFKICICKSFFYCNSKWNNKVLHHVSQIDASSQYPSGVIGTLPTTEGYKKVKGVVKPTEEYPFAFYVKSGHIAIYNELDTHNWLTSPFFYELFRTIDKTHQDKHLQKLDVKNDVTILMKAADDKGAMSKAILSIYEKKENNIDEMRDRWKLILNSFLGCFHVKDSGYNKTDWQFAHLVAVLIARGNQKILNKCNQIGNDKILHIAVDGITYLGKEDYSDAEKGIGKFKLEANDCEYKQLQNNCYAFFKDGKCIKAKHGAMNKMKDGSKITMPKTIDEINDWRKVND